MNTQNDSKWFINGTPDSTKEVRLFTLPYAGGGASIYRLWGSLLPKNVELLSIQLPGRENRITETPFTDMPSLIEALTEAVTPYMDRPFLIFGHSIGARIGFELAVNLKKELNKVPLHLIVSGSRAPHFPEPNPLHQLPDDDFVKELQRFSGTPKAILENKELMDLFMPLLRADFAVDETYEFTTSAKLQCPISVLGGRDDDEASIRELSEWLKYTSVDFDLKIYEGDHFFINDHREKILEQISDIISKKNLVDPSAILTA